MRYLVFSAGTRVGHETALALAAMKVNVRAIVRDFSCVNILQKAGVEVVCAELRAPETLATALLDVDRVVLVSPPVADLPELDRLAIEALKTAGIRRVVKCSAAAADPESPDVFARMHWEGEQLIKQGGFDYTFIRPVFYMQNLLDWASIIRQDHEFCTPMPPVAPLAMVDQRDLAMVAATAVVSEGYSGQAHVVMNPNMLNWQQIAEKLTQVTGNEIRYVQGDHTRFVAQMMRIGASEWTAESAANIYAHFEVQRALAVAQVMQSPFAMNTIDRILGRAPRSLSDFIEEHAGKFSSSL